MAEALYFQETGLGLFIKAVGHITASLSIDVRERVLERLSKEPIPAQFYTDLSECDYMDSTFMGLLVGFHKRFRSLSGQALTLIRPSQECSKLLSGLGILRLMNVVDDKGFVLPQEWELITKSKSPTPEILLNAHQNLSDLSSENKQKFSALEDMLKKQIDADEK